MKLLIFISIAVIGNVCSEILTLNEDRSQLDFLEKILETFLVHQESVTVFNFDKSFYLREQESSVVEVIQRIAPVMIYDELWDEMVERINDMGDELNLPSTTKSYFSTTADIDLMKKHLPLFAKINTNGKWIFAMINIKLSEIESILVEAWVEHKMANILALMVAGDEMRVVSYNPFELHNDKHGKFWSVEVTSESLSGILNKLENIFDAKVKNLQNYKLKATKFFDISENSAILDNEMMKVFEATLNTKFVIDALPEGQIHGYRLSNGSFTGAMRKVEEGLTDIAMNNRLFTSVESTNCAFLNPAGVTNFKYVMRRSPKEPTFLNYHLVQAFDFRTRVLYAVTSSSFVLVLVVSNILRRNFMENLASDDVSTTLLMAIGIQCSVSMPIKKKISIHQRIAIFSLLVFSLITCNAYQGTIVGNLSRPGKSTRTINTMEQLLESDLNLTVITSLLNLFKHNDDDESTLNDIQKRLYHRQVINHTLLVQDVATILLKQAKQTILSKFVMSN